MLAKLGLTPARAAKRNAVATRGDSSTTAGDGVRASQLWVSRASHWHLAC